MIKLSNGRSFQNGKSLEDFINGMKQVIILLGNITVVYPVTQRCRGRNHALSTAIAAIDAAIENAELALKSAQQREAKMKACKKATKPAAKKPAVKKAVKKLVAKKK